MASTRVSIVAEVEDCGPLNALISTGSPFSLLRSDCLTPALTKKLCIPPPDLNLTNVFGNKWDIKYFIQNIGITYLGRTVTLETIFIVDNLIQPILLGCDWFVDSKMTIRFHGDDMIVQPAAE